MAKELQGSCNRCGHCGCNAAAGGDKRWYPGIGGYAMAYGEQKPESELDICALIKTKFKADSGMDWQKGFYDFATTIQIAGGGAKVITECYVTEKGIQKSATDASCPFWQAGTPNVCTIWERKEWPDACRNTPYFTDEDAIAAWEVNHPHTSAGGTCGFWWKDV